MALNLFSRKQGNAPASAPAPPDDGPKVLEDYQAAERLHLDPDPLLRLCQQHRYAAILAQQDRKATDGEGRNVHAFAEQMLEEEMALAPAGLAALPTSLHDQPGCPETEVEVDPFLLAIHPIANARYQHFVDADCYDDLDLWPEEIWPHLIELQDLTGKPGPLYWVNGRHDRRLSDHPVVGISWYEAVAYAKWVGLRLPTEAEWQMAASWRINSEADVFRRFPWGDAMNYQRCNIWGTGLGRTVPVDEFALGDAPNGVRQLIGNVWEWTASDFEVADAHGTLVVGEMPMKSIRGGAFDTYFDTQATSSFRTGLILLARAHNVGFRCACDV
ncbi:MAG: formylglycine-generating enzyme family protein [Planctomycetota bacterium]|jgi:iron(II)-dependent oxidoreductase